jgi:mono/diheme cytochrome c family protein
MRIFLIALAGMFASVTGLARAADPSANDPAVTKRLYISKCARCHKLYDPSAYNDVEWDLWMKKMRKKTRLKTDPYNRLSRYLETLRREARPSRPQSH